MENKVNTTLAWTGERIIPDEGSYMFRRHLEAYQFSRQFCEHKIVLDAGCGEGYGSFLLSEVADKIMAIDISEEAITHANAKYSKDNLEYRVADVSQVPFADNSFDCVVSFQVIEHLSDAAQFLRQIKKVLRKDGYAIISTPNISVLKEHVTGKYHQREWRFDEFMKLLDTQLGRVHYYGTYLKCKKDSATLKTLTTVMKLDILRIRRLFPSRLRHKMNMSLEKTVMLEISDNKPLSDALDIVGVYQNL